MFNCEYYENGKISEKWRPAGRLLEFTNPIINLKTNENIDYHDKVPFPSK